MKGNEKGDPPQRMAAGLPPGWTEEGSLSLGRTWCPLEVRGHLFQEVPVSMAGT